MWIHAHLQGWDHDVDVAQVTAYHDMLLAAEKTMALAENDYDNANIKYTQAWCTRREEVAAADTQAIDELRERQAEYEEGNDNAEDTAAGKS